MKAKTYGILFLLHSLVFASFDEIAVMPEGSGAVHIAIPGLTPESTEDFVYYEAVANDGYEFVQWTGHHMVDPTGNAMKAEIEIPIDGEKRFYRFGN